MTTTAPSLMAKPPAAEDVAQRQRGQLAIGQLVMPLALCAIAGYFAISSPDFLSPRNLSNLAIDVSITAVLALGMLLVILPGHIDLAAGSGVGLFGGVAAILIMQHRWSAPLALLTATVAAVGIWWGMGWIIVRERVPAFIVTLSGLLTFRGLHWLAIHNSTVPVVSGGKTNLFSILTTYYIPPAIGLTVAVVVIVGASVLAMLANRGGAARRTGNAGPNSYAREGELTFIWTFVACQAVLLFVLICNAYRGVPLSAVILAIVAMLIYVITRHTPFGRYLYAIGSNEEAAVISGVPVRRVAIGAFVIMGAIVALTGFLQTAYAGSSTTTVGELMELDAVAACVIGGTSLKGGRGTVAGVLLGALIMATLLNGMTLLAVQPESKFIARGLVLGLAAWADVKLRRA